MEKDLCLDCFNCVISKRKVKYGGEDHFEFFGSCILTGEEVLKGDNSANKIMECNHFNKKPIENILFYKELQEIKDLITKQEVKVFQDTVEKVVREELTIKEKPKEELIKNGNKPKAKK